MEAIHEAQVRYVRFFLPAENMSCESIRVYDRRRLLHIHEEALEIFVSIGRFGENDLKGMKLTRKLFGPPDMLLFGSCKVPEKRHMRLEHWSVKLIREFMYGLSEKLVC